MDINKTFSELAKYQMMQKEIAEEIETLKSAVKDYMLDMGVDELIGTEHRATYREVKQTKLDRKALEAEHPRIAKKYLVDNSYMRLNFS
jgi:predicted transcriptional regulator